MRKYNKKSNISGAIIKEARISKNMSREELSNKLQLMGINVERTFIYKVESENKILKDFELIAICKILEIDYKKLENELEEI